MKEQTMTLNKNSLYTAIPVSGAIILLSVIYYIFDIDQHGYWGYLLYVILLAGIIWGSLKLRDRYRDGMLTYSQGLGSGVLIGLYTGIINAVYSFLFFRFFAPEQIDVILRRVEEQMLERTPQMTDQQLELAMSWTSKFMTPVGMAIGTLMNMIIAALIISLIVSIFLKREVAKSIEE